MGLSLLLTACGDDDIYGTYTNHRVGMVVKITENNIDFPSGNLTVTSWDVDKATDTYLAHTLLKIGEDASMRMNFEIEKTKKGIIIYGLEFEKSK